tara:strand:- start:1237 stop:1593 length:357 start_codon:yes stop_codon:yes gene_type:complete
MSKQYALSERDYHRVQALLRFFDRQRANIHPDYRRRSIAVAESGLQKAYAAAAAGGTNKIACTLNTTDGAAITVSCNIFGGSALNNAIPRIASGNLLTVWNDSGTWRAIDNFMDVGNC